MAHTPGPWKVSEDEIRWWVSGPDTSQNVICDIMPRHIENIDYAGRQEENYIYTDEDRANAALIEAAPDLLEACKNTAKGLAAMHDALMRHDMPNTASGVTILVTALSTVIAKVENTEAA